MEPVTIIGAGLAGSEAAWQLAARNVPVRLIEMRPVAMTPAHHTAGFAELVCSNSLRSDSAESAAGLLKRELADLGSFIVRAARATSVPAGAALAVDRDSFSALVTEALETHPLVEVRREQADSIPEGDVILAAGPLASPSIETALGALIGPGRLSFFDAAAPIVDAETIDRSRIFAESRWGKGHSADYLNCPLDRAGYEHFVHELVGAQRVTLKEFERRELFAACQPVEEIARTGVDALRYGALKPVGLSDPSTGGRPWAVVQLRAENRAGTAYNLVGFQTNLTFAEQRRVFRLIPGLENAEFLRYGVMHRNSFIDAPRLLTSGFALRDHPRVRIAGQLAGTEGYLEAAATGLLAALDVWCARTGTPPVVLPATTALGSLVAYATDPATERYQPMHVNFGLVPPLVPPVRGKQARYAAYAARARAALAEFLAPISEPLGIPAPPVFSVRDPGPAGEPS
jgi:methylenetetrahydrofolate--tRNA-(uracil-5-)-methyltransferase